MAPVSALIVEDGALGARALTRMLSRSDIRADTAVDAASARVMLAATRYTIVIADFALPGGENGLELLRFIHQSWPTTRLIMISGSELAPVTARVDWYAFLAKPFSTDLLLNLIATTLIITPESPHG